MKILLFAYAGNIDHVMMNKSDKNRDSDDDH